MDANPETQPGEYAVGTFRNLFELFGDPRLTSFESLGDRFWKYVAEDGVGARAFG